MRPIPQRPLPVCLRRRSPQPSPPTKRPVQHQGHLCYRRRLVGRISPRAHFSTRAVRCVAVNTSIKALTRLLLCYDEGHHRSCIGQKWISPANERRCCSKCLGKEPNTIIEIKQTVSSNPKTSKRLKLVTARLGYRSAYQPSLKI
jgi:hypothetical protein